MIPPPSAPSLSPPSPGGWGCIPYGGASHWCGLRYSGHEWSSRTTEPPELSNEHQVARACFITFTAVSSNRVGSQLFNGLHQLISEEGGEHEHCTRSQSRINMYNCPSVASVLHPVYTHYCTSAQASAIMCKRPLPGLGP